MSLKIVGGGSGKDGTKEKKKKKVTNEIIDFAELREQKIAERRVQYERVLFDKMLGVYSIVEGQGLKAIELLDISNEGISFQISADTPEVYQKGDQVKVRLYFSQDTYVPVVVNIKNSNPINISGRKMIRYGGSFDKDIKSYEAIQAFAEFIKVYSSLCVKDNNNLPIFIF